MLDLEVNGVLFHCPDAGEAVTGRYYAESGQLLARATGAEGQLDIGSYLGSDTHVPTNCSSRVSL